jgi:rhodanese-related sulfurtransferase
MEKPPPRPPSSTTLRKAPSPTRVAELLALIGAGTPPALLDVREPAVFHPRHIAGSQNAPDSQTTALVRKLQTLGPAVLVCNDGRLSSMVARTLGFCKITAVSYLEGGIQAWAAAGGKLVETTRSGFEHELSPEPKDEEPEAPQESSTKRWLRTIKDSLFGDKKEESP